VSDQWQNRGLGAQMLRMLLQVARDENVRRVHADVLAENAEMQRVCQKAGFTIHPQTGESTVRAEIVLRQQS